MVSMENEPNTRKRVLSVKVHREVVELIDYFVEKGLYSSRSEFIREAIVTLLRRITNQHEKLSRKIDIP